MKPAILALLILLFTSPFSFLNAQERDIEGIWAGKVTLPTLKITTVFYISNDENGKEIVKLDIPEQDAKGLAGDIIRITADSIIRNNFV